MGGGGGYRDRRVRGEGEIGGGRSRDGDRLGNREVRGTD